MYYLAREKLERDRVYGLGHFASSQLSMVTGDTAAPGALAVPTPGLEDPAATLTGGGGSMRAQMAQMAAAAQGTYQGGREHVASAPAAPVAPIAAASVATPTKGGRSKVSDYSMALPRLPAPETSHYSGMSYETSASAAPTPVSPSFAATGAVPRSRDVGTGEPNLIPAATPKRGTTVHVTIPATGPTAPGTAVPTIRAPPAGAHRRSHSMSQRPAMLPKWGGLFGHGEKGVDEEGEQGVLREPRTAGPETTSFEEKQAQEYHPGEHGHLQHGHSPLASGATLVRKFGSLLSGGSVKGGSRSGGISPRTSDVGDESIAPGTPVIASPPPAAAAASSLKREELMTASASTPIGGTSTSTPPSAHRRAQTIIDPAGRNGRHERRSSTGGAALMGLASSFSSGGTIGRHRRPSTGHGNGQAPTSATGKPLGGLFGRGPGGEKQVVEEEKEKDAEEGDAGRQGQRHEHRRSHDEHDHDEPETEGEGTDKEFKPVFLKGLFRCVMSLAATIFFTD